MNKIIIGIGVLAVVAAAWFILGNNTVEYVATMNDEVSQLENELASLEAEVAAGTLSPEDAGRAQAKIVARIDAINGTVSAGQKAKLTDAQRVQLINGLDRLSVLLTKYRATLVAVDDAVLELSEAERPKLNRGGGRNSGNSIAAIAIETIEIIEEQVGEIAEDIVDEEIAAEVEVDAETEVESTEETTGPSEEMSEDVASSTDGAATDETTNEFLFEEAEIEAGIEGEAGSEIEIISN